MPPFVIVAFGTSITAYAGWQPVVEAALHRCGMPAARIVTIAKPGANSEWAISATNEVIGQMPHVVLLEFAINDASLWRGVSLQRSRENLHFLIDRIRAVRPEPMVYVVATNPVLGWRKLMRPDLEAYYNMAGEVAATQATGFIDLRPAWAALGDDKLAAALPDGLHPTPQASRDVAGPAISAALCVRDRHHRAAEGTQAVR